MTAFRLLGGPASSSTRRLATVRARALSVPLMKLMLADQGFDWNSQAVAQGNIKSLILSVVAGLLAVAIGLRGLCLKGRLPEWHNRRGRRLRERDRWPIT
jgi:hypothetical protein